MSRRIADRVLLALALFLIGTGIASAQRGRGGGGGGSFSGAPRATHAPTPAAPFASGPSTFVRHPNPPVFHNPGVNPFPGRSSGVHHPPRVILSQPFVGVYGGFYNPYIYGSPYYTSPAYIGPGYV